MLELLWGSLPVLDTTGLRDVFFVNEATGWIVGWNGTINKTTDGGYNWIDQSLDITDQIWAVDFIDSSTGWVATTGGEIYKTVNGGSEWDLVYDGSANGYDFCFSDISIFGEYDGWACGTYLTDSDWTGGCIVRLTASRPNWRYYGYTGYPVNTIYTYGGETNVFIGRRTSCLPNTHKLSRRQPNPDPPPNYIWEGLFSISKFIHDIDFCVDNTSIGWAATGHGCFYTINGGSNWSIPPGCIGGKNMVTCIDIPSLPPFAWSADSYTIYVTKYEGAFFPPWREWAIDTVTTGVLREICSVQGSNNTIYVYAVGDGAFWRNTIGSRDQLMGDISSTVILADFQIREVTRETITIEIESNAEVTAEALIFDITGRLNHRTDLGSIPEGNSNYLINFGQNSGSLLPNGVYYCVVDMGCNRISSSFVLMD